MLWPVPPCALRQCSTSTQPRSSIVPLLRPASFPVSSCTSHSPAQKSNWRCGPEAHGPFGGASADTEVCKKTAVMVRRAGAQREVLFMRGGYARIDMLTLQLLHV